MHILPPSEKAITDAANFLRTGGIVIHPTETCYGIACDMTNVDAVRRMFTLKERPLSQPVSALFASIDASKEYVDWSERALELGKKYLPGPLTMILPVHDEKKMSIHPVVDVDPSSLTLGIRISSNNVAMDLAKQAKIPISTTSANVHGKPEPYSLEDLLAQFSKEALEPVWMLNAGTLPHAKPSTIVSIKGDTMTLVREGDVCIR